MNQYKAYREDATGEVHDVQYLTDFVLARPINPDNYDKIQMLAVDDFNEAFTPLASSTETVH